jgi:hypothetical protein
MVAASKLHTERRFRTAQDAPHFGAQKLLVVQMEHLRQIGVREVGLAAAEQASERSVDLQYSALGGHEDHADSSVRDRSRSGPPLAKLGQVPADPRPHAPRQHALSLHRRLDLNVTEIRAVSQKPAMIGAAAR